mgnify:CR=1 FL=1
MTVGFSSWTIFTQKNEKGPNISADGEVNDLNRYFFFEGEPELFEYTSEGIVKDNTIDSTNPVLSGYIKIPFQIDVKDETIRDHLFSNETGFLLNTVLVNENTGLGLFSPAIASITDSGLSYNTTGDFASAPYALQGITEPRNTANEASIQFDLSKFNLLDQTKVFFSVRYEITFAQSVSFSKDVYSKLTDGKFAFSFKAGGIF